MSTSLGGLLSLLDASGLRRLVDRDARLVAMISVDDVHRAARLRLPRPVYEFVAGGAETESSVRRNRSAWGAMTFRPHTLVDVADRDLSTTVLGRPVAMPLLLAPAGLARLVHPDGELAAAAAAGEAGTVMALSTGSSCTIEDVAAAASGPLWFQLYLWRDRDVVAGLVQRAAASGYHALCLTVDVPIVGQRERDLRNGMTIPPRLTVRNLLDASWRVPWWKGFLGGREVTFENFLGVEGAQNDSAAALGAFVNKQMIDPSVTWDELPWLRELWPGPLVVKGILTAEDARRAVDGGAEGVVVSNHGGRQLDGAPATAAVLAEVVDAIGDRAEVYVDGGIRRGTDVVRALAIGARAAMVGRPWFWGLAAGGEAGVARVLEIFRTEIDRTLALLGVSRVAELDRSFLG
jgi:L-lactate dehydrogenase (cytochrome)